MCHTCSRRKLESNSSSRHYVRSSSCNSCNNNNYTGQGIQIQIRRPAPQHHYYNHHHHHHHQQNVNNYIHRPVKYAEPLRLPFQQNIVLKKEAYRVLPLTRGELVLDRCPSTTNLTKIIHSQDCINKRTCDFSSKWPYFRKESHYCSCYDNSNNNNYSKIHTLRQPCEVATKENHVNSVHTIHQIDSSSSHKSSTVEHVDCVTRAVSAENINGKYSYGPNQDSGCYRLVGDIEALDLVDSNTLEKVGIKRYSAQRNFSYWPYSGHEKSFLVVLRKSGPINDFGLVIRGGMDLNMPLYVEKIETGGAAHEDNRLKAGDEILEINGLPTLNMTMSEAVSRFKSRNTVSLLVRRPDTVMNDKTNSFIMQF